MRRERLTPRTDWQSKVESVGLTFHTPDGEPYWDESACYVFSAAEIDALEAAGNRLHALCLEAAQKVIDNGWWDRLAIPEVAVKPIVESWERDEWGVYGRFDLAYDGYSPPKLLEYNADTPTSLVEAAVAQWFWLEERYPNADQFNTIHEKLIEAWRRLEHREVWFSTVRDFPEDEQTVAYMAEVCRQSGAEVNFLAIDEIGWNERRQGFMDLDEREIQAMFKLYPWEWMFAERFGEYVGHRKAATRWIEPPWKMLLSGKRLLPLLWELFPHHENLLPAYLEPAPLGTSYVKKPCWGREGANVTLMEYGRARVETAGSYDDGGYIFQAPARLANFDGQYAVFGVWMVAGEASGLGIREDTNPVTGNLSRFVPHLFTDHGWMPSGGS